ncbi:MAG TPA: glucose-6-phosphate isomerase [Phycisphaerae bacterium]|nr:glucose-6-phosphate isomerase [Phycisphaerae bacterium]
MDNAQLWTRYKTYLCESPKINLTLDISRMNFTDDFISQTKHAMKKAFAAMAELEAGAIANKDENRMVGHYWLRHPEKAPTPEITREITDTLEQIKTFAKDVHRGTIRAANGKKLTDLLVIGIGGSALGPQFVADALGTPRDHLHPHFFDNTDPDGMDRVLAGIGKNLARTLTVVISKSGGTKETRNGMLAAQAAYKAAGVNFSSQAVAVTGAGSELDHTAENQGWLKRFPMWDWVGGRTSELSAVGLLPAALQGIKIDAILKGARDADAVTRRPDIMNNPAALMALMWYYVGGGRGAKDMVVLPYKDRLLLLSKYLQQLVMESLGKQKDRDGNVVNQGIAVYGNKGSTDQHAYVQQLREGVNNFFITFIEVLGDSSELTGTSSTSQLEVDSGVTSGDYLNGFYQGTRRALYESQRESMTITVADVSPRTIGILIALFERAVGLYAELININAYHQPGVEAGKKAAGAVIALEGKVVSYLKSGKKGTAEQIAASLGATDETETVFHVLRHLAASGRVQAQQPEESIVETVFSMV